jgi:diguanylate cyclase (GGDEF)-like protein
MRSRVLTFAVEAGPLSWLPPPVSSFAGLGGIGAALEALAAGDVALLVLDHSSAPRETELLLAGARERLGEEVPPALCFIDPQTDSAIARRLVSQHEVRRLLFHPLERSEVLEEVEKLLGRRAPPPSAAEAARRAAALRSLWNRSRETILRRVAVLEEAFGSLAAGDLGDEQRRRAEREAQEIIGSAATYGAPDAVKPASELLRLLRAPATQVLAAISTAPALLHRLREELERDPQARPPVAETAHPQLLIVDADREFVERLVEDTRLAGYESVGVTDLNTAREQMVRSRPDLVLLDINLDGGEATGYSLLRAFSVLNPPVPVIALTDSSVLMDRVQAARFGARVFLQKSISPERILAEIGSLLQRLQPVRPRILAVDADPSMRSTLTGLLAPEGLDVVSLGDPLDFWSVLESTSPDLVVLDVDLPTLSGVELCRIVRNDPRWSSMPVLFLTARTDAETVQRIFTAGADDFVAKPLVGPELMTRIRNRLERSQLLRSLSESDPLTGIANRRRALEMAERLLALARRHGQPFCLALLDLDDFKGVNDRYGHKTGDRVLRRLADVLQRKFRGEDVVGRWGGEEFMLGMYGMTGTDGERRLYDVLASFRSQEFTESGRPPLHVTFSAGIAEFPADGDEFEILYRAADEALYGAKEAGRSRIHRAATDPQDG